MNKNNHTMNIVLLDDHHIVLLGMKDYLENRPEFQVTATFSTPKALISYLQNNTPDIVITDYSMPLDEEHKDGLHFIGYMMRSFPQIKLLVLTMISNPMIISALYDFGVAGVVFKQDPLSEVLRALQQIKRNQRYYPDSLKKNEINCEKEISLQDSINKLSPREYEVLRYFVIGNSIAQIAEKLNRSPKTISLQKNSAMNKLNIESNQELFRFCAENNIFD